MENPIEPETVCDQCGLSLVPLQSTHVRRPCKTCGRTTHVIESGKTGQGIIVREGDQLVIPADLLRMSLDSERASGRFTRFGISWFMEFLYFSGTPDTRDELEQMLDRYRAEAAAVVDTSPLFGGLEFTEQVDLDRMLELANEAKHKSGEWWALMMLGTIAGVREAMASGDMQRAVWEMSRATNSRAMLIYRQSLEEITWRGYTVEKLADALRVWEANRENDDEGFWQEFLSAHAFVLSQVFSFPVIIHQGRAYVGGKTIENRKGNEVDFLLGNQLTEQAALVEIKTPMTRLLGRKYRSAYPPSGDLAGAVAQLSNYRDSLTKDYYRLAHESATSFHAFNPPCLLIAGTLANQIGSDPDKRKGFELF
jgi:hypothetical protein